MPRRRIRAHYEKMSEFKRGRIIGLKGTELANRRITRHMGRSDAAIRRCCNNEWTIADFSVMRVVVNLEPQQIGRTD
ncbi:hypothetical protein TNCV_431931 [Trichonephila clavipes]|nr:hypothetical protein TNCV_431931 [Trichonephila clavipes]